MATKKTEQDAPAEATEAVDLPSSGDVILFTDRGRNFKPFGDNMPLITPKGTEVTAKKAETIMEQAGKQNIRITAKKKEA